jgi:hypothetical protein
MLNITEGDAEIVSKGITFMTSLSKSDQLSQDKRPEQRNMDMRFGTWKIRSLYWAGSLMTVSRELSRYRLDLVGVQQVRWEGSGTAPAGDNLYSSPSIIRIIKSRRMKLGDMWHKWERRGTCICYW